MARTSSTMLNRNGESRYPSLIPEYSRKAFSFSSFSFISVVSVTNDFYYDEICFFYITLVRIFIIDTEFY